MSRADVERWNRTIHRSGDRFDWVNDVLRAIETGGPIPPFPGKPHKGVPEARLDTIRRLLAQ